MPKSTPLLLAFALGALGPLSVSAGHLIPRMKIPVPKAARELCTLHQYLCRLETDIPPPAFPAKVVFRINAKINKLVRPKSDQIQYGKEDHWSIPSSRAGDCEDYAIAKKVELVESGIQPSNLLIATVLNKNRDGHAVLIYRTENGDLVLDNMTNRILPWEKTGYLFLTMQEPADPAGWVFLLQSK